MNPKTDLPGILIEKSLIKSNYKAEEFSQRVKAVAMQA